MEKPARFLITGLLPLSLLIIFPSFGIKAQAGGISYYVSPSGNDANPGTQSQPFKTIDKAKDTVRSTNQDMTDNITVFLREGIYSLSSPIIFKPEDSGTNGYDIIYKNYPGETPIISGGKQITNWQQEGSIWKSFIGTGLESRQLYVNGNRAIRARNNGPLQNAVKTTDGFTFEHNNIHLWQNISDLEFVSSDYPSWKQLRCLVQSISINMATNTTTAIMQQPCFRNAQKHGGGSWYFDFQLPIWIENAFELLDSPGEWYLNKTTGWLYYYPLAGEDLASADIVLPTLETLIEGAGEPDNFLHNLTLEGITFSHATWLQPNTHEGFAQITQDYTITGENMDPNTIPYIYTQIPGNILFNYSTDINFIRNRFIHLGAIGLDIGGGGKNNSIIGNHFTDISGTAIHLGDIEYYNTDIDNKYKTQDNIISNNYIHNIGAEYQGSPAIFVAYAQNATISHNYLFDLPYNGIHIGWGWGDTDPTYSGNNHIYSNYIHRIMKVMHDGGGIHTISGQQGNVYEKNIIDNIINGPGGSIYLDGGSRYITVNNNSLYNNPDNLIEHILTSDYNSPGGFTIFDNYQGKENAPADIIQNAGLQPEYYDVGNWITDVSNTDTLIKVQFHTYHTTDDWIGLYNPNDDDVEVIDWKWLNNTNNSTTPPPNPPSLGEVFLTAPQSGVYEIRYIVQGTGYPEHKTPGITIMITPSSPTPTPTPTPVPLPGDLDDDSDVDMDDYDILLYNFGYQGCGNVADIYPSAGGDCDVDIFDYNILVENFSTT